MSDVKVARNWLDRDHNWANGPVGVHLYPCEACEALAVLDRIEAERDRLREALGRIDFNARTDCPTDDFGNECGCGDIARQALEGTSE